MGKFTFTQTEIPGVVVIEPLIAISLACTAAAAGATLCVMRVMRLRKTKKQKPSQH